MIDNFDLLVERCTARRRTKMIRLSLRIVGSILFTIASYAGYSMWFSSTIGNGAQKPVSPPRQATPSLPETESNTTVIPLTMAPLPPAAAVPALKPEPSPVPVKTAPVVTENPVPSPPPAPATVKIHASRLFEVNTDTKTVPLDPVSAYNADPKYETALTAARHFYVKKEFSEAAVWAKKANQLNREGEEAWLLYAKSYYAQGRKNEAIGVLELYMNYKDSKAASELLHSWKLTPSN